MLDGDLQRAQRILESALAEADKFSDLQTRADALRNLAQNLWRMGQLEPARARLELALEADRFDGDRRGQSSALHYLGLIAAEEWGHCNGAQSAHAGNRTPARSRSAR